MSLPPIELDPLDEETPGRASRSRSGRSKSRPTLLLAISAVVAIAVVVWIVASSDGSGSRVDSTPDVSADDSANRQAGPGYDGVVQIVESIPAPLLAAELFVADPSRSTARTLFETLGGFGGLEMASAEGAFDLVRFDPLDSDRLLASKRRSYGEAKNNGVNELWTIDFNGLEQELWSPDVDHDFVHFNSDGTVTMWVHGGGTGFAPRRAELLSNEFASVVTTAPMYASRFTADSNIVFALTGNGDYYTSEVGYVDLIADDGTEVRVLSSASSFEWIDNPIAGLLVAYPSLETGLTKVWDTQTLELIGGHPLSERSYQRAAISGNGSTAIGVTLSGEAEVIDMQTGEVVRRFGDLDVSGVDQPLTLNDDGSVAITIERSGRVTMWWVATGTPIATIARDAAQPRWPSEEFAPQSTSVAAYGASRVALRVGAVAEVGVHWSIIDTDLPSWVQHACALAGRALTPLEQTTIGLADAELTCI